MKKTILAAASTILLLAGCAQKSEMDKFVDDLLSKMTIEEKIGQLNLHAAAGFISALKVTEEDENVKMLRERYDKPVFIVETGYYNDRQIEGNQWLCDLLVQLMGAGAAGLYYWEPELADDYDLGAWNPLTRKPSLSLDAFLGVKHYEPGTLAVERLNGDAAGSAVEYYTPGGLRIASPQRGLNIVRQRRDGSVRTIKIFR